MKNIQHLSVVLHRYVEAREAHKRATDELRRAAVEDCGFDQAMVAKANPADLVDGYIKGVRAAEGGAK